MRAIQFWTAIVAGAHAVLASPVAVKARSPYAVKETHVVPNRWKHVGIPDPSHIIHLQIGLKQGKFAELEQHLYEGS
jgi:tripeptidyl-peptidase I